MIEGSLDIYWENNSTVAAVPRYRVAFLPYSSLEHGAVIRKELVGEEALFGYRVSIHDPSMEIGRREGHARQWMLELRAKTSLSLNNVLLTEKQASEYSRAATA